MALSPFFFLKCFSKIFRIVTRFFPESYMSTDMLFVKDNCELLRNGHFYDLKSCKIEENFAAGLWR